MKYLIVIIMILSCNNTVNLNKDKIGNQFQAIRKGVIKIPIYPNFTKNDTIILYNIDKSIYAKIINDTLYHYDKKYSIFDDEEVIDILNSIVFYPDYGVWYLFAEEQKNMYKIILKNGEEIFLPISNKILFESYDSFLKNQEIGLTNKSPLYVEKNKHSDIIANYQKYIYKVEKTANNDWVKLKLSDEAEPGDTIYENNISGWTKWKNGYKVNIDFYYD